MVPLWGHRKLKNMILATHGIISSSIGQFDPDAFVFSVKTDNAGVSASTEFRMPLTTSTGLDFDVDWGDGSPIENITNHTLAIHNYPSAGTYTISVTGSILGWRFANGGDRLKMLNVFQWGELNISTDQGFNGCTNLTCSATDAPLITSTSLVGCFNGCSNFNGAIGNWNVSNVTNMDLMFLSAQSFNQDIGSWNTANVTNMNSMLRNATSFNQDISDWNIANVNDFRNFMLGKTNLNYSAANLDLIYNKWSLQSVKPNKSISFGTIKYTVAGQSGKDVLTGAPNNWTITDGGI
jgi:surface protein